MPQTDAREREIEERREAPEREDAELIADSLTRPEAFTGIFDRHYDLVSGFVARRVGRDIAEEIASETFTRAFRERHRYDTSFPSAKPWLLGIATNLLRNHWRAERRRLDAYARMPLDPAAIWEPQAPPSADLVERLSGLPEGQREVLLLHALAELTYEEIAVALDVPVGTVRSRLSRARAAMAAADPSAIEEEDPDV